MNMNTKNFYSGEGYVNPACHVVEVTAEGLLCTSGVSENEFNSTLDSYNQNVETYW